MTPRLVRLIGALLATIGLAVAWENPYTPWASWAVVPAVYGAWVVGEGRLWSWGWAAVSMMALGLTNWDFNVHGSAWTPQVAGLFFSGLAWLLFLITLAAFPKLEFKFHRKAYIWYFRCSVWLIQHTKNA